jgi:uncharacterized protein (TIGR03437 family)
MKITRENFRLIQVMCAYSITVIAFTIAMLTTAHAQSNNLQLQPVVSNLRFPVLVTNARDGSNRLFIVELNGRIKVLQPGATTTTEFIDLGSVVSITEFIGDEFGLLGLAFHPNFTSNRKFYVHYSRKGDNATVIAEYKVSETNRNVADPTTARILFTTPQPFANHNGGTIEFGPDGFLYIALGDGGSGNDPGNRSQNLESYLGKMLRIDVDSKTGTLEYGIPADNPFAGAIAGLDEIYALGLRNPWRCSFDRKTGELYAADVGQGLIEEVDIITRGANYGWRTYEGTRCTNLNGACNPAGFVAPLIEYLHQNGRCSVTGGYVYRGARGTFTPGAYIYGDYCTGEIFSFVNNNSSVVRNAGARISSFGEDELGEHYLVTYAGPNNEIGQGTVYRLVNTTSPANVTTTSAASYTFQLTPVGVATAFGTNLAVGTLAAPSTPLPTTLGGTTVRVTDQNGAQFDAPLFYVSPTQVNFQIPAGAALGTATVTITSGTNTSAGAAVIRKVAPAIFTSSGSGTGQPAAYLIRNRNGAQTQEALGAEIDLGPTGDELFLILFASGVRGRTTQNNVTVSLGTDAGQITFADAQGSLVGVDQINVRLPRTLAGKKNVPIVLTVEGQAATNNVTVSFR